MEDIDVPVVHKKVDEFISNPKKALFVLTWPMLIGMLVQTLYNIVDTAYVGRLGAEALAALTFSFPLFFILVGINSGIATGMSSRISRFLGEKRKQDAENTAMHGLLVSVLLSIIITFAGIFIAKPVLSMFGASGNVLSMANDYMVVIFLGVFFMFTSFTINAIFMAQGNTKISMRVQIIALVANIILDPIFIYTLGMGVKGAAIATVIALAIGFFIYAWFLHTRSLLHIHLKNFHFSPRLLKEIVHVGLPAGIVMILMSMYFIFINRIVVQFGNEYVATLGIVSRLESLAIMPVVAGSMSLMILTGVFYGAKRYDLLKSTFWYSIKAGILFTLVLGMLMFSLPTIFLKIFTDSSEIISIATAYLRIDVLAFPLIVITMMVSRTLQGMGHGISSMLIILLRVLFVSVPLAYLFVYVLGYGFISTAIALVIGTLVSSVAGIIWLEYQIMKMNGKEIS